MLAVGASRQRLDTTALAASAAGGLLLGATLFLSYGLVLAGLLPVAVAVAARRVTPLLVAGAGVAAVVAAFAAVGFWWLDGYRQVTFRYYQPEEYGLVRPYGYWVWADLACLGVVLGPAGVAGLRRVFTPGKGQPRTQLLDARVGHVVAVPEHPRQEPVRVRLRPHMARVRRPPPLA